MHLEKRSYRAGEIIFSQGEPGNSAFIVLSGEVTLHNHSDGRRVEVGRIAAGDIFGEMAVLDGGNRSATASALVDCEVSQVPFDAFRKKLDGSDGFIRALVELFIRNIRGSSRLFLRKPRSFRDHIKQIRAFSWNMRRFAGRMDDLQMADDVLDALDRLDVVLTDLQNVSDLCADKRHDFIDDDELSGVGFDKVVGTEGQRKG